ncbi:MAG: LAGLIDADG family homing endonuclease [Candidatus Aenigmatarchaeota archaeon]
MERGYLKGLFSGDGYCYHDIKSGHFAVEFFLHSEKDKKIQEYLIFILRKLELNPIIYKDKRYHCNRIRIYSKQFYEFINKNVRMSNKEFKVGFISGIIDAEGNVSHKKSHIIVVNTNKELLARAKAYLSKLDINSTLTIKKCFNQRWSKLYVLNISYEYINIKSNSLKVGNS